MERRLEKMVKTAFGLKKQKKQSKTDQNVQKNRRKKERKQRNKEEKNGKTTKQNKTEKHKEVKLPKDTGNMLLKTNEKLRIKGKTPKKQGEKVYPKNQQKTQSKRQNRTLLDL